MKEYEIKLSGEHLTYILNVLSQSPFYQVSKIIGVIEDQIASQADKK